MQLQRRLHVQMVSMHARTLLAGGEGGGSKQPADLKPGAVLVVVEGWQDGAAHGAACAW